MLDDTNSPSNMAAKNNMHLHTAKEILYTCIKKQILVTWPCSYTIAISQCNNNFEN